MTSIAFTAEELDLLRSAVLTTEAHWICKAEDESAEYLRDSDYRIATGYKHIWEKIQEASK